MTRAVAETREGRAPIEEDRRRRAGTVPMKRARQAHTITFAVL